MFFLVILCNCPWLKYAYCNCLILFLGEKKFIAMGVCSSNYPSHSLPGWEELSVGLHLDDASLLQSPNEALKTKHEFHKGDVIKCSLKNILSDMTQHTIVEVEFTCNNEHVISTQIVSPPGGFYGIIGMMSKGESITLSLPRISKKLEFREVWEINTPDFVSHSQNGVCKYIGPGDLTQHFIGTVRSVKPIEPLGDLSQRSFSIRILNSGEKNFIGMGIVNKTYPTGLLPGWEDVSIGYHADSGDIFHSSSDGNPSNFPCKNGDTMQCLVEGINNSAKRVKVHFLRNGVNVGEVTDWTPSTGFYFSFGMMSKGEVVQVNQSCISIPFSIPKLTFDDAWKLENSNLQHTESGICRYVGQGKVGTVRSKQPIDSFSSANHYEVKIIDPGRNCYIALGVCSQLYSTEQLPGWEDLSVGYHADEGAIIQSSGQERVGEPCIKGDVICCTLEAVDGSDKQMNVVFHKNGILLGKSVFWKPSDGLVFAQIGCMGEGEVIQIAPPGQELSHLHSSRSSPMLSYGERTVHVPRPQTGIQDQYGHPTMNPARLAEMHHFFQMYSKFHGLVPSSDSRYPQGPGSLVTGNLTLPPHMSQSSRESSHLTYPQDLSASYPVPYSQASQSVLLTQKSEPPLNVQHPGNLSHKSASSSSSAPSSSAPSKSEMLYGPQFSVSSVSSLESVPEDEGTQRFTSHSPRYPHTQLMESKSVEQATGTSPKKLITSISAEEEITCTSDTQEASKETLQPSLPVAPPISSAETPTETISVDPVILDKSTNKVFKILHNAKLNLDGSLVQARQNNSDEHSFVMKRLPLNEKCNYFEIEIVDISEACNIAVGIVNDLYSIHSLPGALEGSSAFHTQSNCILHGGVVHQKELACGAGDVLGCQTHFPDKSEMISLQGKEVYASVDFFVNGILIHNLKQSLPPDGVFPAIGMTGSGWKIRLNQDPLLKPTSFFEKHPLPSGYLNFEMHSVESTLWHCVANSRVNEGLLFATAVYYGKPGVVQSNLPFSHKSCYFQVRLTDDILSYSVLSIGVASKISGGSKKVIPGEIINSVAYLPLLGFFMTSGVICWTAPSVVGSSLCGKDVTLGVGVNYPSTLSDSTKVKKLTKKIQLFFTVNSQQVHDIFIDEPSEKIFPVFAFEHECSRLTEPLATLEFPKHFPCVDTRLPFGFCRGKHPDISRLFDSSTIKSVPPAVSVESNLPLHSIQASQPLSPARSYFLIKIMDGGETYKISCGLASFNYPMNIHPGWEKNSIALHVDDGNLFIDGSFSNVVVPPRYPGALIGCGIRFSNNGSAAEVFFTVNKHIVACKYIAVPQLGLFPTIGMRTRRGIVEVNIHALDPYPMITFRSDIEIQHNVIIEGSCMQLQSSSNPGAVQMKNLDPQSVNHFMEVTCLSERNGRIMVGYSTNKSCPLNFLKSQAFKACVLDIVTGKLMIYNEYYKSRDSCSFPKKNLIGIGLEAIPNSNMLLLFLVSDGYIVSYTEIDIEESEIYPCLLMMDSTTKVDINWCSAWPKLTPIGYGWGVFVNLKQVDSKIIHSGNQSKKRLPVGYAQSAIPFSRFDCYFEVEICCRAVTKAIAIGLASRKHSTTQWIGWSENSIGYHTDDGKMFKESSSGQSFGPKAYAGDVIGCGARMGHICTKDTTVGGCTKVKIEIFFTINGALLSTQKMTMPPGGLFPTICLESPSESVIFHRFKNFPPVSNLVDPEMWNNAYSVKQTGKVILNSCRHKEINGGLPKAFCQAKLPFSPEYTYFQVEISSIGTNPKGSVFVGAGVKIPVGCTTPNTHSVLYSSAGFILTRKGSQKNSRASVKCGVGDIVGCLVLFNNGEPTHFEVYLNHSKIFTVSLTDLWNPQDLFPTIILSHPGDSIIPNLQLKFPSWYTPPVVGWLRSERVQVHKNIVEYTAQAKTFNDIGVAQVSQPLQLNASTYFEVEVISVENYAMGVGIASSNYSLSRQPGWCKDSIAYHGDDGKLFHEEGSGVSFGPVWKQHDIIGVGIRPDPSQSDTAAQVFFSKNGIEIGHSTVNIPSNGLYPTVGFHSEGLKVKIVMGEPGTHPCNMCPMRSQWRALVGINISKSSFGQLLKYYENGRTPDIYLLSLAIYGRPLCDKMQYFEVKIHTMGPIGIAIGVVPQKYSLKEAPGWGAGSVAYHTDNGRLYSATPKGKLFGPIAHCGDCIGCGIIFHQNNTKVCSVFFTYNGTEIGRVKTTNIANLYPAVALTGSSDSVSIKFMESWKPKIPLSDSALVNLMRINNCSYVDQIISFVGSGHSGCNSTPAIAQFSIPLSKNYSYYCAGILDCNDDTYIGLAVKDYPLKYVPGSSSISIAYDVKKGNVRAVFNSDNFSDISLETCKQGDVIGCGIYFTEDPKKCSTYIFFTRNHKKLCKIDIPDEVLFEDLYPIVGFFPQKKFSFLFMHWNTFKFSAINVF